MEGMKEYPDGYFDLAVVDPPYFKGAGDPKYYNPQKTTPKHKPIIETWHIPTDKYFLDLFRISKKQIIFGCNYYQKHIPHPGRIVWDKKNDTSPFSQCEIASYSEGVKVSIFRYKWNGMLQENMKNKEFRIHPTQKPVALYLWLLNNYAKPGDLILDTHVGSASSLIACEKLGFNYVGYELDKDYYKAACDRLNEFRLQVDMFIDKPDPVVEQERLEL